VSELCALLFWNVANDKEWVLFGVDHKYVDHGKNVVIPATNSVFTEVPRSLSLKNVPLFVSLPINAKALEKCPFGHFSVYLIIHKNKIITSVLRYSFLMEHFSIYKRLNSIWFNCVNQL